MDELVWSQAMYIASLAGAVAFALSGFIVGTKHKLDLIGLFILSFLTANGGGILRDILTDRPPVILQSNEPFLISFAVTLAGSLFKLNRHVSLENRWIFVVCDAVGLVAFAITGSLVALSMDAPLFGLMTLAFLTAAGGAILRDILVNDVPQVLHSGFYGSIAILVGVSIYALDMAGLVTPPCLLAVFTSGLVLRLIAYHYQWKVPKP